MSWWWAGAVGAAKKKLDDGASSAPKFQSVGLIIGDTSLVGNSLADILPLSDTPGGPWKVVGVSPFPKPPPADPPSFGSFEHIVCDLSDPQQLLETLAALAPDLTHLFYDDLQSPALFKNLLDALLPAAPNLQHICLLTSRSYYAAHESPFLEELPRPAGSANPCYQLEDILTGVASEKLSWSVHRPAAVVFGFSPSNGGDKADLIAGLCIYAAICKKEGVVLRWPGSAVQWEGFSDASDADLVAEHQIWAAVDPYAKNEAFNCSNGDVFKWKHLWKVLAEQFGVEFSGFEGEATRFKLAEVMEGKGDVWDEIVRENELVESKLEEVVDWGFVDEVLNGEESCLGSMNKSKEHGFLGFRNSVSSFVSWIDKAKAFKTVPSS